MADPGAEEGGSAVNPDGSETRLPRYYTLEICKFGKQRPNKENKVFEERRSAFLPGTLILLANE